jgi:hypothetical protein
MFAKKPAQGSPQPHQSTSYTTRSRPTKYLKKAHFQHHSACLGVEGCFNINIQRFHFDVVYFHVLRAFLSRS